MTDSGNSDGLKKYIIKLLRNDTLQPCQWANPWFWACFSFQLSCCCICRCTVRASDEAESRWWWSVGTVGSNSGENCRWLDHDSRPASLSNIQVVSASKRLFLFTINDPILFLIPPPRKQGFPGGLLWTSGLAGCPIRDNWQAAASPGNFHFRGRLSNQLRSIWA